MSILNIAGQTLVEEPYILNQGEKFQLPANITSGVYFLKVKTDQRNATIKFVAESQSEKSL